MADTVVLLGPDNHATYKTLQRYQDLAISNGSHVEVKLVDQNQPEDDIVEACKDAVALLPVTRSFTTRLIRRLPNLKLIQVISAGTDWMDKPALYELGVKVANNGGGNRVAVSEHTIALMIAAYRRLDHQMRGAKEGKWASEVPGSVEQFHTLEQKKIGIAGFGRIGQAVAQRLQGWECEIFYYDVFDPPAEVVEKLNVTKFPLDELLEKSDIVTLHVDLQPSTFHMIGARELGLMKNTAILINACRGPVVDELALIKALKGGEIAGAGLDVLEQEPTDPCNPILAMDNVVVTPHLASRAIESNIASTSFAMENLTRLALGEEPISLVPPS